MAAGLQHTGAVSAPARWLFGRTRRLWIAQLRIMFPTAIVSAFINNTPVVAALREQTRGTTVGRARHRLRGALLAIQVALGLVLLVGSGLVVRSLLELRRVDPGFDTEQPREMCLSPSQSRAGQT